MIVDSTTRRRSQTAALLIAAASVSRAAHASATVIAPDCTASGDGFGCRLLGILNLLYAAAGVLALVLIVVIIVAVKSYRKNNRIDERHGS